MAIVKTVKVKCEDREDGVMRINATDFDKKKHTLVREKVALEKGDSPSSKDVPPPPPPLPVVNK